jgi:hypothetical protein
MVCLICGVSLLGIMSIMYDEPARSSEQLGAGTNAPEGATALRGAGAATNSRGAMPARKSAAVLPEDSIYRLHASKNDGGDLDLASLVGKVSLVVNVASH